LSQKVFWILNFNFTVTVEKKYFQFHRDFLDEKDT